MPKVLKMAKFVRVGFSNSKLRAPTCIILHIRPTVRTSGANLGERDAPRFLICVRRSGDGERDVEVCPSEEQAGDEAGTRYQRRGCAHEDGAATGGGTPCARGRHAMEPERRRHQFQPLSALRARASRQAGPRNTTQESSKFFIHTSLRVGTSCDTLDPSIDVP